MSWKDKRKAQKEAKKLLQPINRTVGGEAFTSGQLILKEILPTSSDWCPTLPGNLVEVSLNLNIGVYNQWEGQNWHRVSVWGGDDMGMEKDFKGDNTVEAISCFYKLKQLKDVSVDALIGLGFGFA